MRLFIGGQCSARLVSQGQDFYFWGILFGENTFIGYVKMLPCPDEDRK